MDPLRHIVTGRAHRSRPLLVVVLALLGLQCSQSPEPDTGSVCLADRIELESALRDDLDSWDRDTDFTLMMQESGGRSFTHSTGTSSPTTSYRSASTSKWVTAIVVLDLVDQGVLDLDDRPQDFIPSWPTSGSLSQITLRHLLSFTSGLVTEPICIHLPTADFESCVMTIADRNASASAPGQSFHYGSAHMQVAGLMAVKASSAADWRSVFSAFKARTGLFPTSEFDLPSASNPRLAGGMHWTGSEYLAFIRSLASGSLLTQPLREAMGVNQVGSAVIADSPALDGIGEDWRYGLGVWLECHSATFNCSSTPTVSSAGAYGAYPFWDRDDGYYGIIAREGGLTSFDQGYRMAEAMRPQFEAWAAADCE